MRQSAPFSPPWLLMIMAPLLPFLHFVLELLDQSILLTQLCVDFCSSFPEAPARLANRDSTSMVLDSAVAMPCKDKAAPVHSTGVVIRDLPVC